MFIYYTTKQAALVAACVQMVFTGKLNIIYLFSLLKLLRHLDHLKLGLALSGSWHLIGSAA